VALALFDLDNTLADRAAAFIRWTAMFCDEFNIPDALTSWIVDVDGDGFVPRLVEAPRH
jgi:putative hydrolase of the HAD superfamily